MFFMKGAFTGKQQGGIQNLFDSIGGSAGAVEDKAASQGMDPALIQVSNILHLSLFILN